MKKPLNERFQQLAGRKPLYHRTQTVNEQVIAAAAGIVGMISAAGGLAALQIAMEKKETREKHPKLAAFLDILDAVGSAASAAKRGGSVSGGPVNEQDEAIEDTEIANIEDELVDMFDIKDSCPVPTSSPSEDAEEDESDKD